MRLLWLCRNRHELRFTPLKIIKPWHDGFPPQGLSEVRRGSAVFTNMLTGTDPLRGRPISGAAGFIASNQEVKSFITYIC